MDQAWIEPGEIIGREIKIRLHHVLNILLLYATRLKVEVVFLPRKADEQK
jgi:hypothetical protein